MKKLSFLMVVLFFTHSCIAASDTTTTLTEQNIVSSLIPAHEADNDTPDTINNTPLLKFSAYDAIYINQSHKITPKKQHEESADLYYSIDVTYPQITGKELTEGEQQFNQRITNIVNKEMEDFKNSVKRDIPHMQTLPVTVRKNNFQIDYDIDLIHQLSLVSVRLTIQSMQAGRAHPYRTHKVLNFDLINNKELALSDLFKPKVNYLQTLASYSNKKLNQTVQEKDKWMIEEGAKPLAKNYKHWNIAKNAILITFDEYQVAPYVYGPQEVEIPYSELQALLSPQAKVIASLKNNKHIG